MVQKYWASALGEYFFWSLKEIAAAAKSRALVIDGA
jgi:hypothetical protein